MKITDHKQFAHKALEAAREFMELHDWTMYFSWNTWVPEEEGWAACMKRADYERFNFSVEVFEWFVKEYEDDPEYVAQVMLHEVLHVFTIAPLKVLETDKTLKEFLWTQAFYGTLREMLIFNEQMNVKLEYALMPHFKRSEAYRILMDSLWSSETPS